MERIQCALNDGREVLRVEPVEEEVEGFRVVASANDTSQNVEQLHHVLSNALRRLHGWGVHGEYVRDLRRELLKIAWKLPYEFFCDPHAAENAEELPELFHLIRPLKNVKLVDVCLG